MAGSPAAATSPGTAVCEGQYRHLHVQRLRRELLPDQGQQTARGRQGRARQVLRPRALRRCGGQRQPGGTQVVHRALQIQHTGLTPAAETTKGSSKSLLAGAKTASSMSPLTTVSGAV